MKSRRSAILNSPRKLRKTNGRSKAIRKGINFLHPDNWEVKKFGKYDCIEHARWATFFRELDIPFDYQPRHFGINVELGIRPHFFLRKSRSNNEMWFHCCKRQPLDQTRFAGETAAELTGIQFAIAQGPMHVPQLRPQEVFSMPICFSVGEGCHSTRFFCERRGMIELRPHPSIIDVTTNKLRSAFLCGCALGSY